MKEKEAAIIIDQLRDGSVYKYGEYQQGYTLFFLDKVKGQFIERYENTALDMANPEVSETKYTEKGFIQNLVDNYDYCKVKENLLKG
jgi:hypothetical protein